MSVTPRPRRALPAAPGPNRAAVLLTVGGVTAVLTFGVGLAVLYAFAQHKRQHAAGTPPATAFPPPTQMQVIRHVLDDPPPPPPPPKPRLPPEKQAKVDEALAKGLAYLRGRQRPNGTWDESNNPLGTSALAGLVLLECGAPPDDDQVRRAAAAVRAAAPNFQGHSQTYELSLALLFLDRLGSADDTPLIRSLALRLIAGQTPSGGWSYRLHELSPGDEHDLLTLLEESRPRSSQDLFTTGPGGPNPGMIAGPAGDPDKLIAVAPANDPFRKADVGGAAGPRPAEPDPAKLAKASPVVRNTPALRAAPEKSGAARSGLNLQGGGDNSNTQFAILAVWAAGRHGVPTERCLALIDRRFRTSQQPDGGWGYAYAPDPKFNGGGTPAMTCAGLLGLAVGHGANARVRAGGDGEPVKDPCVTKGMQHLAALIGRKRPNGRADKGLENLYFLWSLERVAVLYNLDTLEGTDWYAWGSDFLVSRQSANGSWAVGNYHGSNAILDTNFALLFLKRANLAQDLSNKIETLVDVKDLGGR